MRFRLVGPWILVLALGVLFSLYLQTLVRPNVFYSCDGGLKFLYTRQLAERGLAGLRLDLDLEEPEWVTPLWRANMYPFEPPFVWESAGRRYVEYPPFFSWMTAPLFRALGFRGLYLLPLLAVWGSWLAMAVLCRRRGLAPLPAAAALALLVFATPVTLYSAMYWEHTLALLLLIGGLIGLGPAVSGGARGIAHGVALGLSAWLRPEHLLFSALVFALLFAPPRPAVRQPGRRGFLLGLSVSIAAFFLWNLTTSGALLGWQGLQLTTPDTMPHLGSRLAALVETTRLMALTCPVAVAALALGAVLLASSRTRQRLDSFDRLLLGLLAAFWLAMPLAFPNTGGLQWGARYLLPLAPIAALLAVRLSAGHPAALAAVAAAGIAGSLVNCGSGVADLARNYRERQTPAMELLLGSPVRCVLTNTHYVTMELTAAFGEKIFFVLRDPASVRDLALGLARGGEREILLLMPGQPPRVLSIEELLQIGAEAGAP